MESEHWYSKYNWSMTMYLFAYAWERKSGKPSILYPWISRKRETRKQPSKSWTSQKIRPPMTWWTNHFQWKHSISLTYSNIVPNDCWQNLPANIRFSNMDKGVVLNVGSRSNTDAIYIACIRKNTNTDKKRKKKERTQIADMNLPGMHAHQRTPDACETTPSSEQAYKK